MITTAQRIAPAARLVWPAAGVSLLLVAVGGGLGAPLAPLVGVALLAFIVAAPASWTAGGLLGVALLVDNPGERPMDGLWTSPLYLPGELLYLNLHKHTGIGALRFSALELAIAVLMVVVAMRKLQADPIDDPRRLGALPNPMKLAFASMFGAVLAMMAWGILRGGDTTNALWQARQLVWLPVLGVLFGHSLKTAAARLWLVRIVIATACLRALTGIYFYFVIARPAGYRFEYVTTHSDSILAVVAVLLGIMALIARPSRDNLLLNLVAQPILLVGLIVNDRRLAFVALFGGLVVAVLLAPAALRRVLRRVIILSIPLLIVYTAVGWNSNAGVFRPVGIVRSVTSQEDASSATRDIENYNLISTLKRQPVVGSGFGHEYTEFVQAYRVDHIFAQYLYIAHNSVLWLISQVGWLGFACIWIVFPTAALIALRVLQQAGSSTDVLTGFGTVAAILAYLLQAWGDMGFQSWMGTLLVAAFMGATGSLLTSIEQERSAA
jgi:hypothetical protein